MSGNRQRALIRDIAVLFVSYKLSDWELILTQLRDGGATKAQLAADIEEICNKTLGLTKPRGAKPMLPKKHVRITKKNKVTAATVSVRYEFIHDFTKAIRDRKILPTAGDLRELYYKIGGKGILPEKRDAATRFLRAYFEALPDERFQEVLKTLDDAQGAEEGLGQDYQRWFDLIHKPQDKPKTSES